MYIDLKNSEDSKFGIKKVWTGNEHNKVSYSGKFWKYSNY